MDLRRDGLEHTPYRPKPRCRVIEKWIFHAVLADSLKNPFDSSFARYVSGEHVSLIHQLCQNIKLVATHHSPIVQTALRYHASAILQRHHASIHQDSDAASGPGCLAAILPGISPVLQSSSKLPSSVTIGGERDGRGLRGADALDCRFCWLLWECRTAASGFRSRQKRTTVSLASLS